MACLVMRRVFTKSLSKMWGNLKPSTQNVVKSELVRFMQGNADPDLLKKVTDCAATLAIGILPDGAHALLTNGALVPGGYIG